MNKTVQIINKRINYLLNFDKKATLCLLVVYSSFVFDCNTIRYHKNIELEFDTIPKMIKLNQPMELGRAEAFFELYTGGDQMSQQVKLVKLLIVLRYYDNEYRYIIASCSDPSLGSALGGGTNRVLEVALCNGEYWLISEPGKVIVLRTDEIHKGEIICNFELPDSIKAVTPEDR
jgi:hypothetical protein